MTFLLVFIEFRQGLFLSTLTIQKKSCKIHDLFLRFLQFQRILSLLVFFIVQTLYAVKRHEKEILRSEFFFCDFSFRENISKIFQKNFFSIFCQKNQKIKILMRMLLSQKLKFSSLLSGGPKIFWYRN